MRKLKRRQGFTLVEIIVVIAIIGVLAAILIPTMLGYVTRAHVANSNSTAGKMRDSVTYFMTQAGSEGYGMFRTHDAICDVDVEIKNGNWTVKTSVQDVFLKQYATLWTGSGTCNRDTDPDILNAEERMASHLANAFVELENGYCRFRLVGGMCYALYFTDEQTTAVDDMPPFNSTTGWDVDDFHWGNDEGGITVNGVTVGTSPVIIV